MSQCPGCAASMPGRCFSVSALLLWLNVLFRLRPFIRVINQASIDQDVNDGIKGILQLRVFLFEFPLTSPHDDHLLYSAASKAPSSGSAAGPQICEGAAGHAGRSTRSCDATSAGADTPHPSRLHPHPRAARRLCPRSTAAAGLPSYERNDKLLSSDVHWDKHRR